MAKQTKTQTTKTKAQVKKEQQAKMFNEAKQFSIDLSKGEGFKTNETVKGTSVFGPKGRLYKVLSSGKVEINIKVSKQDEALLKKQGFRFYENPKLAGNVRYYGPITEAIMAKFTKWFSPNAPRAKASKPRSTKAKTTKAKQATKAKTK